MGASSFSIPAGPAGASKDSPQLFRPSAKPGSLVKGGSFARRASHIKQPVIAEEDEEEELLHTKSGDVLDSQAFCGETQQVWTLIFSFESVFQLL